MLTKDRVLSLSTTNMRARAGSNFPEILGSRQADGISECIWDILLVRDFGHLNLVL
jgi:hypothetical protein